MRIRKVAACLNITVAISFLSHAPGVGVRGFAFMTLQIGNECAQVIGQVPVVIIEICHILALRRANARVAGSRETAIAIMCDASDAASAVEVGDHRSHVHGAIVDDNDFEVLIGLSQDTGNSLSQTIRPVMRRDDDRDHRLARKGRRGDPSRALACPHLIDGNQIQRR